MDETKYLKQLQKQGLLTELIWNLGPKSCKISVYEARSAEKKYMMVSIWEKDPRYIRNAPWVNSCVYELNDYMLFSGIEDDDHKKLQKLYDYMKAHFDTYTDDCIKFLKERQDKKLVRIDEDAEQKKKAIKQQTENEINRMLGNK